MDIVHLCSSLSLESASATQPCIHKQRSCIKYSKSKYQY